MRARSYKRRFRMLKKIIIYNEIYDIICHLFFITPLENASGHAFPAFLSRLEGLRKRIQKLYSFLEILFLRAGSHSLSV